MQTIVVKDDMANSTLKDLNIRNDIVNYKLSKNENVSINNKKYVVDKNNGEIELNFENISDSEIYVYFDNINYENKDDSSYSINIQAYNDDILIENENLRRTK